MLHESPRAGIEIPLPCALPAAARREVELAIEQHLAAVHALTVFLDDVDGDPDLEPSLADSHGDDREGDPADDEPELGWPAMMNQSLALRACCNDNIDGGEPSLGSTNAINQAGWARGARDDREEEHDRESDYIAYPGGIPTGFTADMEPDVDLEPPLPPFELVQVAS